MKIIKLKFGNFEPHNINFLSKLSEHFWINSLRFEHFHSHFLTAVRAFVPDQINWSSTEFAVCPNMYSFNKTYRSPKDPDATLFPIFSWLVSISQTSIPSLGISMQSWKNSGFVLSTKLTAETEGWDGERSCNMKNHYGKGSY